MCATKAKAASKYIKVKSKLGTRNASTAEPATA